MSGEEESIDDNPETTWALALIHLIKGTLRAVGALIIAGFFLLILMTAIAQQSVIASLNDGEPKLKYSIAHETVKEVERRRGRERELVAEEQRLTRQQTDAQRRLDAVTAEYEEAWQAFQPLARRVTTACAIELSEQPESAGWRSALWSEAVQCRAEDRMPASLRSRLEPLFGQERNFMKVDQEFQSRQRALTLLQGRLRTAQADVRAARNMTPQEQKALFGFAESDVLRKTLWLGGDFLIAFPPSLLQLFLAAASGAFGALLITLVLIVYPGTSLRVRMHGKYGARVLLGALIAVCVYIMLLGGSAVLGTANASMAGANYMTFCAVAVLAGMFSDRVADWLSGRADAFFRTREEEQQATRPNGNSELHTQ